MLISSKWNLVLLVVVTTLCSPLVVAESITCEELSPQPGDLGYQLRGDRCEGLYIESTRSSVRLKAVTTKSVSLWSNESAFISAKLPSGAPEADYHFRLQSINSNLYYQLDAAVSYDTVFTWPTADAIRPASISPEDIAPLTWINSNPRLYVPVTITDSDYSGSLDDDVVVIVESTVPIRRYVARLKGVDNQESVEIRSDAQLPSTMLEFAIPGQIPSGRRQFWLRVVLAGEATPEQQSWTLWLP